MASQEVKLSGQSQNPQRHIEGVLCEKRQTSLGFIPRGVPDRLSSIITAFRPLYETRSNNNVSLRKKLSKHLKRHFKQSSKAYN